MVLPSLDQNKRSEPDADFNQFHYIIECLGSEAIQQRQDSVNKKDFHPANVQIRPMKEEDAGIAVANGMRFGAPRPRYYGQKLDSATKGAGINTSSVAEVWTGISQVGSKG